jgi:hypothetical protein
VALPLKYVLRVKLHIRFLTFKFFFVFQRIESEASGSDLAVAAAFADDDTPIASPSSSGQDSDGQKDGKKKKNRCLSCKKKVGLTGT